MKVLSKIQNWGDHHHPQWLDFFRLILGGILIWKGIAFLSNLSAFTALIHGSIGATFTASLIAHAIIVIHMIGGFLILLGTNTRWSCFLNLPVPLLALLFSDLRPTIFSPYADVWLSVAILSGLICFLIEGNGSLSIDRERR